jgi:hypothetical protein
VTDEIVVHEVHVAPVPQPVECVEFPDDLLRSLLSRLPAIELDDVAELAIERAATRELDTDHEVVLEIQKIEARHRALLQIRFFGGFINSARGSSGKIIEEERHGTFRLSQDEVIGGIVDIGLRGRIGSAGNHFFASGVNSFYEPQESRLLGQHSSDENKIGPVDVRVIQGGYVQVDKSELPVRREKSGHGDDSEGRCWIPGSHQPTDILVVPEPEGREFGVQQQSFHPLISTPGCRDVTILTVQEATV